MDPTESTIDPEVGLQKWNEFLGFCNRHARANHWFRGVSNIDYPLIPKIGRPHQEIAHGWNETISKEKREINLANREKRVFDAFKRRAVLDLRVTPASPFQWLALAQHHGVPTRMLDWTTSPLMAAWFAVRSNSTDIGRVAKVHALFISSRQKVHEDEVDPFKISKGPVFVVSPQWHPRVRAQRGCFSIHPEPHKAYIPSKASEEFPIEQPYWAEFRKRLYYFGIDASTVMGDLQGLGEALAWQYETQIGIGQVGY